MYRLARSAVSVSLSLPSLCSPPSSLPTNTKVSTARSHVSWVEPACWDAWLPVSIKSRAPPSPARTLPACCWQPARWPLCWSGLLMLRRNISSDDMCSRLQGGAAARQGAQQRCLLPAEHTSSCAKGPVASPCSSAAVQATLRTMQEVLRVHRSASPQRVSVLAGEAMGQSADLQSTHRTGCRPQAHCRALKFPKGCQLCLGALLLASRSACCEFAHVLDKVLLARYGRPHAQLRRQ